MCGRDELLELDVTGRLVEHIRRIDAICRYHTSCDSKINQIGYATTENLHVDLGAARPLEHLHHLVVINVLSSDETVTDVNDSVACHDAALLRRSAFDGTDDGDGVFLDSERHANTFKAALQVLSHLFKHLGLEIFAVRIHQVDDAVHCFNL